MWVQGLARGSEATTRSPKAAVANRRAADAVTYAPICTVCCRAKIGNSEPLNSAMITGPFLKFHGPATSTCIHYLYVNQGDSHLKVYINGEYVNRLSRRAMALNEAFRLSP